jgi:uncharacterized membrane protein YkvA (DUF1232 family)
VDARDDGSPPRNAAGRHCAGMTTRRRFHLIGTRCSQDDGQTMTWQERVRNLKRDVMAIALAVRDPRVPWYAKAAGACVVAYALSPIDLIPDFVPVLGYLDDLVLVPLGLMLVLRLIPADVLAEHRVTASALAGRPVSRAGAVAVIGVWMLTALLLATWLGNWFGFLGRPGVPR